MDNLSFGNFVIYRPDKDGDIFIEYDDSDSRDYYTCLHEGYINIKELKEFIDRWYKNMEEE